MYEITTEPDNHAGSEVILSGLKRGERVARIELAYSAWKSIGDGNSESRLSAIRRTVEPNSFEPGVTNEAQIRTVFDVDVAYLLHPAYGFFGCNTNLVSCAVAA